MNATGNVLVAIIYEAISASHAVCFFVKNSFRSC